MRLVPRFDRLECGIVFDEALIFRYDFELFNYTLKGYLEVGRVDEDPSDLLAAINLNVLP